MFFMILDRLPRGIGWLTTAALLTVLFWGAMVMAFIEGGGSVAEWIQGLANTVGVLALWGFGFRRRFFSRAFWRYFFVLDVGVFLVNLLIDDSPGRSYPPIAYVLFAIVYMFYYAGLFEYAFRSYSIWEEAGPNKPIQGTRLAPRP